MTTCQIDPIDVGLPDWKAVDAQEGSAPAAGARALPGLDHAALELAADLAVRAPTVPAAAAQRQLRRLLAVGYAPGDLADKLGLPAGADLPMNERELPLAVHARTVLLYADLRLVKAQRTKALLATLRHEGFMPGRLQLAMAKVVEVHGGPAPSLAIGSDKIPARTERLVLDLYHQLMT